MLIKDLILSNFICLVDDFWREKKVVYRIIKKKKKHKIKLIYMLEIGPE